MLGQFHARDSPRPADQHQGGRPIVLRHPLLIQADTHQGVPTKAHISGNELILAGNCNLAGRGRQVFFAQMSSDT
jgi:hypothetical protein